MQARINHGGQNGGGGGESREACWWETKDRNASPLHAFTLYANHVRGLTSYPMNTLPNRHRHTWPGGPRAAVPPLRWRPVCEGGGW